MELMEAIKGRRSVRKYKKGAVIEKDVLKEIADAGNYAPSARSVHPWKFIVITDRKRLDELTAVIGQNGRFLADASAAIIVLCEDTKYYIEDGAAATQNILLAAYAKGLGTCWIAGDKKDYAETVVKFVGAGAVPFYRLVSIVCVGVPAETPNKQKPKAEQTVKWESF